LLTSLVAEVHYYVPYKVRNRTTEPKPLDQTLLKNLHLR